MLPAGYENDMNIEKFKAEMNATDMPLHPMACSGPEAWAAWHDDVWSKHPEAYLDARDKMGLGLIRYTEMTEAVRSAFAYSVEDRIAWKAKGIVTKKGRKR